MTFLQVEEVVETVVIPPKRVSGIHLCRLIYIYIYIYI